MIMKQAGGGKGGKSSINFSLTKVERKQINNK